MHVFSLTFIVTLFWHGTAAIAAPTRRVIREHAARAAEARVEAAQAAQTEPLCDAPHQMLQTDYQALSKP